MALGTEEVSSLVLDSRTRWYVLESLGFEGARR